MIAKVYDVLDCSTEPAKFYKVGVGIPDNTGEARVLKWTPRGEREFDAQIIARMPAAHLNKMLAFLDQHVKKLESTSCIVVDRPVKALRK